MARAHRCLAVAAGLTRRLGSYRLRPSPTRSASPHATSPPVRLRRHLGAGRRPPPSRGGAEPAGLRHRQRGGLPHRLRRATPLARGTDRRLRRGDPAHRHRLRRRTAAERGPRRSLAGPGPRALLLHPVRAALCLGPGDPQAQAGEQTHLGDPGRAGLPAGAARRATGPTAAGGRPGCGPDRLPGRAVGSAAAVPGPADRRRTTCGCPPRTRRSWRTCCYG